MIQTFYYGYRFYNASTGRWLSRDPIRERGGKNLYGFVRNNPISLLDLIGLVPHELTMITHSSSKTEFLTDWILTQVMGLPKDSASCGLAIERNTFW
ncbi:MAG: RHS repeat-associated core domain-containing protein [Verrucomicrobiales bacterium]